MTDEQAAVLRKLVERGLLTAEQAARIDADCAAPGGPEDPVRAAVARGFLREDALRGLMPRGAGAPSPSTPTLDVTVTRAGAAPAPVAPAPERLGRFEILEEIGRGGMGIVYRGWDADLSRIVALKVVQGISTLDDPRAARFRREAQTVARLRHPNIVQVHEVGEDHGRVFLSLEYINGTTLGRLLQDPAHDLDRIVEVLATVCDALDFAHREGVVHRDVKPENVLLDGQGRPYLADFGLAKEVFDTSRITASGDVVGTPAYMAPEQARGARDRIGPATDIYAVGAILYEALTGRPPFRGEGIADIIYKVVNDEPERPSRVAQGVPEDLESICLMCLQKEPSARYVTARDLAEDLRRHLQRLPVQARHPSALSMIVRRTLKRRRLVAASLLAAVAIGLSLWAWWRRGGTIELSGLPPSAVVLLDGRTCPSVASGARLDLSAGRHELSVSAPGYATWTQSIDLSRGELLRLPCGATRKVGTALFTVFPSDATVRLEGPGGTEASTPLGIEGPPLPTGAWTARATAPGFFPRETAFEVLEGNRTAICLHLDPIVRWEVSTEDSVYATPLLRDFDGDGLPDVWFMSRDRKGRVVSGIDGREIARWTVPLRADSSLEAADLDGDGRDEVVYGCDDGTIRAWSFARGGPLWEFKAGASILSTPLLQDVNGDGTADVLMGTTGTPGPCRFHAVDGRTGKALWSRELGDITSTAAVLPGTTPPDVVVAVDRVGIVCLRGATGETRWSVPVLAPFYCSVAVGDLDGDGAADVVAASDAGAIRGIRGDGKEIWCRDIGAAMHGSPALGDIDGDGRVEVVVASQEGTLFEIDGARGEVKRSCRLPSPAGSSPVLVDFDGDGAMDIAIGINHSDTCGLLVVRGVDFQTLLSFGAGSDVKATPVVGNLDGEGGLELVVASYGRKVTCLSSRPPTEAWSFPGGSRLVSWGAAREGTSPLLHVREVADGGFVALDATDGRPRWRGGASDLAFGGGAYSSPRDPAHLFLPQRTGVRMFEIGPVPVPPRDFPLGAVGTILSLGERDGRGRFAVALESRVACVDMADGSLVWERRSRDGDVMGIAQIASARKDVDGDGEEDLLASLGRELCALSGRDGKRLWSIDAPGRPNVILAGLKGPGGREYLLYGSNQHHLLAYEVATGGLVWQAMLPGPMVSDIAILPDIDGDGVGDVLVTNSGQGLLCRSGADGTRSLWQSPEYPSLRLAGIWPAEGTRKAMVVAYEPDEGRLLAFDMKSGRLVYGRRFPPSAQFLVHPSLPGLVVVACDGLTRAIRIEPREVSLPWPSFRHDSGNSGDARR